MRTTALREDQELARRLIRQALVQKNEANTYSSPMMNRTDRIKSTAIDPAALLDSSAIIFSECINRKVRYSTTTILSTAKVDGRDTVLSEEIGVC